MSYLTIPDQIHFDFVDTILSKQSVKLREKVLDRMIKTIAGLTQEKIDVLPWNATEQTQPVLCIAIETFDTVDMIPPLGAYSLFTDHHVIHLYSQRNMPFPVIDIVQTALLDMRPKQRFTSHTGIAETLS